MTVSNEDVSCFCVIVFEECIETWNISRHEMAKLIKDYKLVVLLHQHFEYFNAFGKKGIVLELEKLIF